jgi:hypothetical protein
MDGIFELAALNGGLFGHKVSEVFSQVIQAVENTGKAGKLTITVDVSKTTGGMVALVAKVTDKTPEPKPDADVRWVTEDGQLTRDNPKQQKLALRVAGDDRPAIREAAGA